MKRRKMKKQNDFIALSANEEYNKVIGGFVWIIFTDLPKDVFIREYAYELSNMKPYIILSTEHLKIIVESHNSEERHERWMKRNLSNYDVDDPDFYEHHPDQSYEHHLIDEMMFKEQISKLFEYMERLSSKQRSRLTKYFLQEKTLDEIAKEEGISRQAVMLTIDTAIKKLKKMLK